MTYAQPIPAISAAPASASAPQGVGSQSDRVRFYQRTAFWPTVGVLFLLCVESVISAFTYPYFSLALEAYGLSNWLIGLNASLAGFGILLVGPFLPGLIATFGLARLTGLMFALPLACFIGMAAIDHIAVWFLARFIMGACFAGLWATTEIWLNGVVDDRLRGRAMSLAMVAYTGAQFVGPLLASATGATGMAPFIATMVPLAIAFVVTILIADSGGRVVEEGRDDSPFGFRQAFPIAGNLLAVSFLIGVASTAIQSLLPLFAVAQGLTDTEASQLVAVFGLGELIFVIIIGLLADRFARWSLFRLCGAPTIVVAVMLPFVAHNPTALAGLLFIAGGTLGGIYTLGLIVIGQDLRGNQLVVVATAYAIAYSAGTIIGSTPGGYLIDTFGPGALPIGISASLLALAFFTSGRTRALTVTPMAEPAAQDDLEAVFAHMNETAIVRAAGTTVAAGLHNRPRERALHEWFLRRAGELNASYGERAMTSASAFAAEGAARSGNEDRPA